ncbi:Ubiquitin-conjugating enzyme E2 32 [Ancistrocladus abbreviatus]
MRLRQRRGLSQLMPGLSRSHCKPLSTTWQEVRSTATTAEELEVGRRRKLEVGTAEIDREKATHHRHYAEDKYNRKNPAVKRILQEVKEMQSNPSDDFMSLPLEENIFEWQFAIRGPRDTEFEGGIYHGRIQLPAEYPFKPPSFMMLTPNGRFETPDQDMLKYFKSSSRALAAIIGVFVLHW